MTDAAIAWTPGRAAQASGALAVARSEIGVQRTALFWLEPSGGSLACVATAGPGESAAWVGQRLASGLGMAARAVAEGRPVWTPDLLADPRVPIAPWLRERLVAEGLRAVAAAPVRLDGQTRGALGFLDGAGRTYDAGGLARLGRLAEALGRVLGRPGSAGP